VNRTLELEQLIRNVYLDLPVDEIMIAMLTDELAKLNGLEDNLQTATMQQVAESLGGKSVIGD